MSVNASNVIAAIAEGGSSPRRDLKEVAIKYFADANRWKRTPWGKGFRNFDGGLTHKTIDHPLFFKRDGQPVCVVGQPYDPACSVDEAREEAARRGLVLHVPPARFASIHYPGACSFFAFTRPNEHVNFLPEQSDPGSVYAVTAWFGDLPSFEEYAKVCEWNPSNVEEYRTVPLFAKRFAKWRRQTIMTRRAVTMGETEFG